MRIRRSSGVNEAPRCLADWDHLARHRNASGLQTRTLGASASVKQGIAKRTQGLACHGQGGKDRSEANAAVYLLLNSRQMLAHESVERLWQQGIGHTGRRAIKE